MQTEKGHIFILTRLERKWKSQVFAHRSTVVGDILRNRLHSTLIQNYGGCPELLLRIAGERIVEGAHRLLHPGFAFNIVVYIAIDFFVNLRNLSYAFKSIFLEGSIGFLRLSKGLWHEKVITLVQAVRSIKADCVCLIRCRIPPKPSTVPGTQIHILEMNK